MDQSSILGKAQCDREGTMNEGMSNRILQVVAYFFLGVGILAGILVGWVPLSRGNRGIVLGVALVLIIIGVIVEYGIRRPRLTRFR
jgi:hypothetical protein